MNKVKGILISVIILLMPALMVNLKAQENLALRDGQVSYVSSQNVYVKFESTAGIQEGDTLFTSINGKLAPALVVKNISSISCVCTPLPNHEFKVGDQLKSRPKVEKTVSDNPNPAPVPAVVPVEVIKPDTAGSLQTTQADRKTDIVGRVSVASYLNFSDAADNSMRMRYTVNFNAYRIGGSKLSVESYLTFSHKNNQWDEISKNIHEGLKIYNLSLSYEFSTHHQLWLGRRINPRISNVGAIDGVQYEYRSRSFSIGAIAGSRPDYQDYSFNPNLLQYGAYVSHEYKSKTGNMQSTLAFMQQTNNGNTDRTFAYLQHSNALIKNLYFFGSVEMDLYNKTYHPEDSSLTNSGSPKVSNLYLSLRYRPVKILTLAVSYSARQNVIYYESYKDYLATLLEAATVNGFLIQATVSPMKRMNIGVNASFRDSKNDPRATKTFYGYISYTKIPGIEAYGTISATYLETSYINSGMIYSANLNRDFIKGKMNAGIGYRYVSYDFVSGEVKTQQQMPELSLTWRILRKLSCSLYYEGTFDNISTFNRIYINFTQRF